MTDLSSFRAIALVFTFLIGGSHAQAGFEKSAAMPASGIVIYGTQPGGHTLDCVDTACTSGPLSIAAASALKKADITIAGFFDVGMYPQAFCGALAWGCLQKLSGAVIHPEQGFHFPA